MKFPRLDVNVDMSDGLCFCCGTNNPIGLKLNFKREGDIVKAEFKPSKFHQGWPGILHGGIITCLLDEAMTYAARLAAGVNCVTAKIEVQIKQTAPLNQTYTVCAFVTRRTRKLIETEAQVLCEGLLVANARAKQFVVTTIPGADNTIDAV